ncbi:MAG: tetratricopeptide repeat protein [Akkermansiaceae bacterium]|nr:tetratricopeptide repeat protein [Verrucomicrobiales bacterium]
MQEIEPPDSHHLSAAIGWLELGNLGETESDLNRISAANQCHPDVLEVRWIVFAQTQRWEAALQSARALLKMAPNRCSGWLHQAYALRRVSKDGLKLAWEALLPASKKFPREATIPYNLSCYACQMDQLNEARGWFQRALLVGDKNQIKQMALEDSDLQPLWTEIRKL